MDLNTIYDYMTGRPDTYKGLKGVGYEDFEKNMGDARYRRNIYNQLYINGGINSKYDAFDSSWQKTYGVEGEIPRRPDGLARNDKGEALLYIDLDSEKTLGEEDFSRYEAEQNPTSTMDTYDYEQMRIDPEREEKRINALRDELDSEGVTPESVYAGIKVGLADIEKNYGEALRKRNEVRDSSPAPVVTGPAYFRMEGMYDDSPEAQAVNRYGLAKELYEKAGNMLDASFKGSGFLRGVKDTASDWDTWTSGLTKMVNDNQLDRLYKKVENGEILTADEERLLDAATYYTLAGTLQQLSSPSVAYNIGRGFTESVPYMIEFALTYGPASSVTRGLARAVSKKLGRNVSNKIAKKGVKVLAEGTEALATGSVQTPMGWSRIAADTRERMMGEPQVSVDKNGRPIYIGREEGDDFWTALLKSTAAQYITNVSEVSGGMLGKAFGFLSKPAQGAIRKITDNRYIKAVRESDFVKWAGKAGRPFKIGNAPEEMFEEYVEGTLNALTVGDTDLDSLYSWRSFKEIAGVVLLTQAAMGGLGMVQNNRFKGRLVREYGKAEESFGRAIPDKEERDLIASYMNLEMGKAEGATPFDVLVKRAAEQVVNRHADDFMQEDGRFNTEAAEKYRNEVSKAIAGYFTLRPLYDAYLSGITGRKKQEEERIREEITGKAAGNSGKIVTVVFPDGRRARVTGENVVLKEDGTLDVEKTGDHFTAVYEDDGTAVQLPADDGYRLEVVGVEDAVQAAVDANNEMIVREEEEAVYGPRPKVGELVYVRDSEGNPVALAVGSEVDENGNFTAIATRDYDDKVKDFPVTVNMSELVRDMENQGESGEREVRDGREDVRLSDELDENGRQFVLSSNGTIDFGQVEEASGLTPAPIRLSEGVITNYNTNAGYGLVHIEARHGEQIRNAGYASVLDFIQEVARNYQTIREGAKRHGEQTYLLQLTDKHNNTLIVELSKDGSYWNINTAGIFKKSYANGNKIVYDRQAAVNQSAETDEGAPTVEQSDTQTEASPMPSTTTDKGNESLGNKQGDSALSRIPKDEKGNPVYEQTDSDTAWDAIVEQTEGDEIMAQTVADGMVADKEAALKKLEKAKSKGGVSIAEKIAAEKERKAEIDVAKQELAIWQKIAGTANRRKMEAEAERRRIADEVEALRKAEEERLRAGREEAERIEREALNGVPDMVDDKPTDARARGYRRMNGHKIDRQQPLEAVKGKGVQVRFSDSDIADGRVAVIDASRLQPSHVQGVRNPLHFIDEAQPKERNDEASVMSSRKIAANMRPEEITTSVTAYTGAPTVNSRGEVIQGNNRSDALKQMWDEHKEQSAAYKQYLIDHAEEFGLNPADIDAMERPVLVNMLDVDDKKAIELGQFVAQDTESGGMERIKPKNAVQKMGNDMRTFANLLLASGDEEISFAGLIDNNGAEVLKWMRQKGYITPTQYQSAFDTKGNLTAEAKNDLRGILYQSIFKGGSTRLEEMFNTMPARAQKAILATAYRDYDSPSAERMIEEVQNSIRAFYALMQTGEFANAKNFKEARMAVEAWKRQYRIDDATGESYLPADNFSNFALHLAAMYRGESQSLIQSTFNKLYDLIQGTQEANLFEQPDNTPRTLAQAIKETLNIDYNGQQRSNVLVGDSTASQDRQGGSGTSETGERVEGGNGTADGTGGVDAKSTAGSETVHQPQPERKGSEQNTDERREADSSRVADDTARKVLGIGNRGDIRVFEEGLASEYNDNSEHSERTRREAESERLVSIAKKNGLFIPSKDTHILGEKFPKRTGESVVYIDRPSGKVYKVKDPYAKSAMKSGVQPEDAIYEHTVHNLLFPETEYTFEGISEELGDVRIILSQNFIETFGRPTPEQIAEALAARGLYPEDNYSFGNELVSVSDIEGENVLLGEDGTVYFIDPIIRFKKPVKEIISALSTPKSDLQASIETAESETNANPAVQEEDDTLYRGEAKSPVQATGENGREESPMQREVRAFGERMAERLGGGIRFVYSREIPESEAGYGKKREAYGYYDTETGDVVVVLDNHTRKGIPSVIEVAKTVMHEVVGHKGVRGLLGHEGDSFLDGVYRGMKARSKAELESKYGGQLTRRVGESETDFESRRRRLIADEYIAQIAEQGNNPGLLRRVIAKIREVLRGLGVDLAMTDNDIREILRRSARELTRGKNAELNAGNGDLRFRTAVNERFNEELDLFEKKEMRSNDKFNLGMPSDILIAAGLPYSQINMTQSVLRKHLDKHGLSVGDIKSLPEAIGNPVMVYEWGDKARSSIIITDMSVSDGRMVSVAIRVAKDGERLSINEISSIHGKELQRLINEINTDNSDFGRDNLKYVDKEKALKWFAMASPLEASQTNPKLLSATKVIKEFENPKVGGENAGENTRYRLDDTRGGRLIDIRKRNHTRIFNSVLKYVKENFSQDDVDIERANTGSKYMTIYFPAGGSLEIRFANHTKGVDDIRQFGDMGNGVKWSRINGQISAEIDISLNDMTSNDIISFIGRMKEFEEKGYPESMIELLEKFPEYRETGDPAVTKAFGMDIEPYDLSESIRYRAAEEDDARELIGVHNLSEENLRKAFELGGFPMPSIAVTKAEVGHTSFGDISLLFDKNSINPTDRRNKVYGEDAWTPTFPQTGYKLNDDKTEDIYRRANKVKGVPFFNPVDYHPDNYERFIEGLGSESLVKHFMDDYGAKQFYLSETGNAVKEYDRHEVEKYLPDQVALYEKMLAEIGIERLKNESGENLDNEVKHLIGEHYGIDFGRVKPAIVKVRIANSKNKAVDYAENGNKSWERDFDATKRKIDERIDAGKFGQWLEDMFSGVVEKIGIRNDRDPFTQSGNRRKWEQLYDELTLDNVVKAMQRQRGKGGQGLFGGSIFGAAQREYKTIEEIRESARERIRNLDDEEAEAGRKAITDRLSAIDIPTSNNKAFGDIMDMVENITEAVSKSHTPRGIYNYLRGIYPKMTMDVANEIADIVKEIQQMSARYFEAKPSRAVGFEEVRLAIVPEGTDATLVSQLESQGIPVRYYEKGNDVQRRRIVAEATEELDIRFRIAAEEDYNGVQADAAREYETALDTPMDFSVADMMPVEAAQNAEATRILRDMVNRFPDTKIAITDISRIFAAADVERMEGENVRYRQSVNERFNDELEQQIDGTLPKGHVYELGRPSEVLLSAGLPNLPIEMAASRLSDKSMQENHPFDLSEVKNLPQAIQEPMAVFRSATHIGSFVVMTEIEHKGKNFVAAIEANRKSGKIEVNSIRSLYPKNNNQIANWIEEGLIEYADKKRVAEWLSKQRSNSADVRKLFNHAANIVKSFENPKIGGENIRYRHTGLRFDEKGVPHYDTDIHGRHAESLGEGIRRGAERAAISLFDEQLKLKQLQNRVTEWLTGDKRGDLADGLRFYDAENQAGSIAKDRKMRFDNEYKSRLFELRMEVYKALGNKVDDKYYYYAKTLHERTGVIGEKEMAANRAAMFSHLLSEQHPGHVFSEGFFDPKIYPYEVLQDYARKEGWIDSIEAYIADCENRMGDKLVNDIWGVIGEISEYELTTSFKSGLITRDHYDILMYGRKLSDIVKENLEAGRITDTQYNAFLSLDLTADELHKAGFLTNEQFKGLERRYAYYLPLKGDSEPTSEDTEHYEERRSRVSFQIKSVKGGNTRLVNDPISRLLADVYASISYQEKMAWMQSMYQALRLADRKGKGARDFAILDNWVVKDEAGNYVPYSRNVEGTLVFTPTEGEIASGDVVKADNLPVGTDIRIPEAVRAEHLVRVKHRGRNIVLYFRDLGIATAINNHFVPRKVPGLVNGLRKAGRFMASAFTSYNPMFVFSNIYKDFGEAAVNNFTQYGTGYAGDYVKNYFRVMRHPLIIKEAVNRKLKPETPYEKMVEEFFKYGGEVSYTQIESYEKTLKDFEKELRRSADKNGVITKTKDIGNRIGKGIETANKIAELNARIATFITSRERGYGLRQSIRDAKEVTVNFDRRGKYSAIIGSWFLFWNAGRQSNRRKWELMRENPRRFWASRVAMWTFGAAKPYIMAMLASSLFGVDWEEYLTSYFDIPDYIRYKNMTFLSHDGHVYRIPMSPSFSPDLTLAENVSEMIYRKVFNDKDGKYDLARGLGDIVKSITADLGDPINWDAEGGGKVTGLAPAAGVPFAELLANSDFTGRPIYKEGNSTSPGYKNVYRNTKPFYTYIGEKLNSLSGGEESYARGLGHINPATVEHIVEGYLGGLGDFVVKMFGFGKSTVDWFMGEDDKYMDGRIEQIPFLRTFYLGDSEMLGEREVRNDIYEARKVVKAYNDTRRNFVKTDEDEENNPRTSSYLDRNESKIDDLKDLLKLYDEITEELKDEDSEEYRERLKMLRRDIVELTNELEEY